MSTIELDVGLGGVTDLEADGPIQIAHGERPGMGMVRGREFEVFDGAALIVANTAAVICAIRGEVLVGLLRPMSHAIGGDVDRMRTEPDPMGDDRIYRESGIENGSRIV